MEYVTIDITRIGNEFPWISVEQCLPKFGERVIVWGSSPDSFSHIWEASFDKINKVWLCQTAAIILTVEYWMPISPIKARVLTDEEIKTMGMPSCRT